MTTARDLMNYLEGYFPLNLAAEWDNSGLQFGHPDKKVHKVLLALDVSAEVVSMALSARVDMIITHHPFIFSGIKNIDFSQPFGSVIAQLIQADVVLYAAHTNLDRGAEGLNQHLAERLGLQHITLLDNDFQEKNYKVVTYVPPAHADTVRNAMMAAGAGFIGSYSDCSFMSKGVGTFKPLSGTHPYIGSVNRLEKTEEVRLETIVPAELLQQVVEQIKVVHPYEEAAYDVFSLTMPANYYSFGRVGILETGLSLQELAVQVKQKLQLSHVRVIGALQGRVHKVATVSGSGASFISKAASSGAEVLVTGDLKYHEAQEAERRGLCVIDAGHQGTEHIAVDLLYDFFRRNGQFTSAEFFKFAASDLMQII